MRSHISRLFENKINEIIEEQAALIVSGSAYSYDNYKEICGVIRGLKGALNVLDEIEKELD